MDLDAYFRRIDHTGPREPTLAALTELHWAHITHIPFENLDVQLGLPVRLDLEALEDKLVRRRRGGYCFEHNNLLLAVLERLGFRAERMEARVRWGHTDLLGRTHLVLRVRLPEGDFLVDAGFGGQGPLAPVPFDGREREAHGEVCRLLPEGRVTVLQRRTAEGWADLYALEPGPVHLIDCVLANHYTSTHPDSGFVRSLTAQMPGPGPRRVLRNRTWTVFGEGLPQVRELSSPEELLDLLRAEFGLDFPAGTRFRTPEF